MANQIYGRMKADDDVSFGEAFKRARKDKADEFMWRGKRYTTEMAKTPPKLRSIPEGTGGGRGRKSSPADLKSIYDAEMDRVRSLQQPEKVYGSGAEADDLGPSSPYNRTAGSRYRGFDNNIPSGKIDEGGDLVQTRTPTLKKGGKVKKMASGGRARSYEDMDAGSGGGMGRIEKTAIAKTGKKIAMKYKKGGKVNYAKGGEAWEGSKADEAQDKKLAKKYGMSMKEWEASSQDAKHDRQKSAKGLKRGGEAMKHDKGCKCMMCGGKAKYAAGGKMSISQTGMKTPLRPKPTAMAKGGKVTFADIKPLPGTKTKSNPGMILTGASTKSQGLKGNKAKASGAKPSGMMSPLKQVKSVKMAKGGSVRGTGIARKGFKFIGEV